MFSFSCSVVFPCLRCFLAVVKEDVGDGIIIGVLVNLMSQIQSYDGYAQPAKKRMKYSDILTLNQ